VTEEIVGADFCKIIWYGVAYTNWSVLHEVFDAVI
jgi:hypothetical protein